jgi:hypothetical protein
MPSRIRPSLILSLAAWFAAQLPHGVAMGAEQPGALKLTTERVVVFKDGYGLFVKSGSGVTDRDGNLTTPDVPDAVLGTVWASAEGHELLAMTAARVQATDQTLDIDCDSAVALLRANPGKVVSIHTEKADLTGRIVRVLEPESMQPSMTPPQWPQYGANGQYVAYGQVPVTEWPPAKNGLLVLDDTPGGRLVIPAATVLSISGKDLGTDCKRTVRAADRPKVLTFQFGRSVAGHDVRVHLFYFAPGVRWIPSYRIATGDGATAAIELQAEVLNEVEDLNNVAVDLVVGVPNFRFKDVPSPLTLESTLRETLSRAAPSLMADSLRMAAGLTNAAEPRAPQDPDDEAPVPSVPESKADVMTLAPNLKSEARQDLFTYAAASLTLPRGARAIVPLWSTHVPQRHLYTADLRVTRNPYDARASLTFTSAVPEGAASPGALDLNPMWHQLELTNDSSQPWTTGAALLLQGYLPLGQDLLTYTSKGARTDVPITVAVDLHVQVDEKETDRAEKSLTWNGRNYSQILKKGTVTVTSHRADKSVVRVTVDMGGDIELADEAAHVTREEGRGSDWSGLDPTIENHSRIVWNVDLAPGETRKLPYTVSFYR